MKSYLKKTLVYVIATMLAVPVSLMTNLATTEKAKAAGEIIVSEFSPVSTTEWVELLNTTSAELEIGGWYLVDSSNNTKTIPADAKIPANGLYVYETSSWLNNTGGDSVTLKDAGDNIVAAVSYGDVTPTGVPSFSGIPNSTQSIVFSDSFLVASDSPSKGWFNGDSSLSSVAASLTASGVNTNLGQLPNPSSTTELYFEVSGLGKMTLGSVTDPINLTDQKTVITLSSLETALKIEEGKISFTPSAGDALKELGGALEMYNLSFANGEIPAIYVEGNIATTDDFENATYADGTLTFEAKHFSTYSVNLEKPELENVGFTSDGASVPKYGPNYYVSTNNDSEKEYLIQFDTDTQASEGIESGVYGLYLIPTEGQTESLVTYYVTKPEAYKTYLNAAAAGTEPFTYIKGDGTKTVKLLDGARYTLASSETDMAIPGNYPEGVYTVKGEIADLDGTKGTVEFSMLIDRTAPVITLTEGTAEVVYGSVYTDPGATALDNIDGTVAVTNDADKIDTLKLGEQTITYSTKDKVGHEATETRIISVVYGDTQTEIVETTELTEEVNEVVVPATFSTDAIVNIPESVDNAVINLAALVTAEGENQTATLGAELTIVGTDATVVIPAGAKITGDSDWDGKINALQLVKANEVALPQTEGNITSYVLGYEIGLSDAGIQFDQPVKLVFKGYKDKKIGYIGSDSKFNEILNICADPNTPKEAEFSATGECKANDGEDLVVWTKHFTKFVVYTEEKVIAPAFTATSYDENGEYYVKVEWEGVGGGVEEYWILVNDAKSIVKAGEDDLGKKYSTALKIATFGDYKVIVKSSKQTITSANTEYKTVKVAEIKKAETSTQGNVELSEAPVVTVGPQRAVAAPKAETEQKVEQVNDDSGVIKGDESAEDEEEMNWTPWIILFILIVLAGAATGGYFYWFAGEEELPKKQSKTKKVEEKKEPVKKSSQAKSKKKYRRW